MTLRLELTLTQTFCPECGLGVKVDEEGCCVVCGATAEGAAVEEWIASRNRAVDEAAGLRKEMTRVLKDARQTNRAWKAALKRIAELESRLEDANQELRECTCCED